MSSSLGFFGSLSLFLSRSLSPSSLTSRCLCNRALVPSFWEITVSTLVTARLKAAEQPITPICSISLCVTVRLISVSWSLMHFQLEVAGFALALVDNACLLGSNLPASATTAKGGCLFHRLSASVTRANVLSVWPDLHRKNILTFHICSVLHANVCCVSSCCYDIYIYIYVAMFVCMSTLLPFDEAGVSEFVRCSIYVLNSHSAPTQSTLCMQHLRKKQWLLTAYVTYT